MIEVKNLTKRFGKIVAVNNISFTVNDGEIVGFLGPNGAGKSTTMNMMTGFISSTEGTVLIDGYDILEEPEKAKRHIGYLPEQPPIYADMTVTEYLEFVCDLKKVKKSERKEMLADILESVKLTDVKDRITGNLSKGYRQRVGLAQALIGYPETLILDEPTVGLDPKQVLEMRDVIRELGKKHTVILSSHILQEVSAVCDRIIIINKGEVVAEGSTEDLSKEASGGKILLEVKAEKDAAWDKISALESVKKIEIKEKANSIEFTIEAEGGKDIREELFSLCSENDFAILTMKPLDVSLEDIFMKVISGEMEEEALTAAAREAEKAEQTEQPEQSDEAYVAYEAPTEPQKEEKTDDSDI